MHSQYIKKSQNSVIKSTKNPIKWAKDLNSHFPKKIIYMANKRNIVTHQGNANYRRNDTNTCLSEWMKQTKIINKQKSPTIPSAGENAEQRECLEITGWNVKWQSDSEKQFGRFL